MLQSPEGLAAGAGQLSKSSPKIYFHGKDRVTECFRIKFEDGRKARVKGAAYAIITRTDNTGKSVKKRKLIGVTPGWTESPETDDSFVATGAKSGKRVRLIGTIELLGNESEDCTTPCVVASPAPHKPAVPAEEFGTTGKQTTDARQPIATVSASSETGPSKPAYQPLAMTAQRLTAFKYELDIINAQRASGLDPNVSIATISRLTPSTL